MTTKLPGGLGILGLLAILGIGGLVFMKMKGNGNGGAPPTAMYGAKKVGGCGCGK